MNKEYVAKSINKMGNIGYIIAKICRIALIVGAVGTLVGAIVFLALPDDLFDVRVAGSGNVTIHTEGLTAKYADEALTQSMVDNFKMELNNEDFYGGEVTVGDNGKTMNISVTGGDKVANPNRLALLCFVALIYIAASFVVFFFVEKLCKSLKTAETPFSEDIITGMERFAWALIPWALVHTFCEGIMNNAFSQQINYHFGLGLSMILAVLLVFGLVRIFKYGAALQQESDETL